MTWSDFKEELFVSGTPNIERLHSRMRLSAAMISCETLQDVTNELNFLTIL